MTDKGGNRDEYAGCARVYDPLLNPLLDRTRRRMTVAVLGALASLPPGPGKNTPPVLDLCCGTGRQAALLQRAGLRVSGVDLSPAMLAVARERTPGEIDYYEEDASATHFPDRTFGCVTVSLALHEKPDPVRRGILREGLRLLVPGGSLLLLDYRRPNSLAGRLGMAGAALVERLAGKVHHAHYREFLASGALRGLAGREGLSLRREAVFFNGCMGLYSAVIAP